MNENSVQCNYTTHFDEVISLIRQSRINVLRVANTALIDLYWNVGEYLHRKLMASE